MALLASLRRTWFGACPSGDNGILCRGLKDAAQEIDYFRVRVAHKAGIEEVEYHAAGKRESPAVRTPPDVAHHPR
jgi:hypothetical protein